MQQQDTQKITPVDAQNLIQFSIASICQSEKVSYINQQGLNLLTQSVIDDILLIARTARTATANSDREVTNTTDVALALGVHNIDLADVTHYISAPLRTRAGLTTIDDTTTDSPSLELNNSNNNTNNNNIPLPIPTPIDPHPQQYPVNFNSEQTKPLQNRLAAVNGTLTSLSTQPTHRDLTHIPPYFPTPIPPSHSSSSTFLPTKQHDPQQQTVVVRQHTSTNPNNATNKRTRF